MRPENKKSFGDSLRKFRSPLKNNCQYISEPTFTMGQKQLHFPLPVWIHNSRQEQIHIFPKDPHIRSLFRQQSHPHTHIPTSSSSSSFTSSHNDEQPYSDIATAIPLTTNISSMSPRSKKPTNARAKKQTFPESRVSIPQTHAHDLDPRPTAIPPPILMNEETWLYHISLRKLWVRSREPVDWKQVGSSKLIFVIWIIIFIMIDVYVM